LAVFALFPATPVDLGGVGVVAWLIYELAIPN